MRERYGAHAKVLFEDVAIVVVDKPAGQNAHPEPGYETGALTDELVRQVGR